ncbi:MAG: Gfo/Idh/MocA family oxidoreductase [Clostridiales bacterium]|jgi:predicted dehydrogenase|nr:Gfo/Idh/MocA family oxidoreductase [Clostridiales bacterium]
MANKLKAAFIGCGGIAKGKHLPAQARNKDVELYAFCDILPERAAEAKAGFGTENSRTYADYRELLRDKAIDVVFVLTPNNMHCEITVAALNAGKHVMCEKPMAMNYAEAQKMLEARDRSGKLLTIGYQNRYRSDSLYLKKLTAKKQLGDVYYAEAVAIRRRAVPTWGVFIDEEKQGGGPLIDIGTHALDLTLFMMDNYQPAYCLGQTFHKLNKQTETGNIWGDWDTKAFTAEDSAFGFVVMKNGAVVYLKSSWALNYVDEIEAVTTLCGDKGGADMLDGLRINTVLEGSKAVIKPDLKAGAVDFFDGEGGGKPEDLEARTFTNAVLGKGKLYVTADQAAVVTQILEGIYLSAKSGKPHYF